MFHNKVAFLTLWLPVRFSGNFIYLRFEMPLLGILNFKFPEGADSQGKGRPHRQIIGLNSFYLFRELGFRSKPSKRILSSGLIEGLEY